MGVVLLHGLVPTGTTPSLSAPRHRLIACDRFLAVVSPAPDCLEDISAEALANLAFHHNAVLVAYCIRTAVLPMRFGAAFSSFEAVRTHLNPSAPYHAAALQTIACLHEYTLRLQIVSDPPVQAARVTSGRDFLTRGREVRDQRLCLSERRRALAQRLLNEIEPISQQIEAAGNPKPERLLDIAILLDKSQRDSLATIAGSIAEMTPTLGLDLTVTGPWPAYSFHPVAEYVEAKLDS